jgi:hypothetical protein
MLRTRTLPRVSEATHASLTAYAEGHSIYLADAIEAAARCLDLRMVLEDLLTGELAHLADGEQCTLIRLKQALAATAVSPPPRASHPPAPARRSAH